MSRYLGFLETGSGHHSKFLSLEWLRDEDIPKVKKIGGKLIEFDEAEKILFDVKKMRRIFREMGILPRTDLKSPIESRIDSTEKSVVFDDCYPDFLRKFKSERAKFIRELAVKNYINYHKNKNPADPYAECIKNIDHQIVRKVVKGLDGSLKPSTIEKTVLTMGNIRQLGRWMKYGAERREFPG